MNTLKKHRGVALVMAILIVAMVAIISVHMITQRQLQFYRTANLFFRDQAYQYSMAVEGWGMSILFEDFQQGNKTQPVDSQHDMWNTALFDIEVDQVTLDGTIFDLQGRFNLNNLVKSGKVQAQWLDNYKRLLASLGLSHDLAETLVDWLDSDQQPTGSYGAEDLYYISLDKPYRTANQPLVHLSELLLVKGYDKNVYTILKPYVFVAPEATKININSATNNVLRSVIPGLSESVADSLLSQIETKAYDTTNDLVNDPLIKNIAVVPGHISVSSNYFAINSYIKIDKTNISMQSIVKRDQMGKINIVSRQESLLYEKHIAATN